MAYMNQENKKRLATLAKAVLPSDWKVSFSVKHNSGITATISKAPASVMADYISNTEYKRPQVNIYHLEKSWKGETLKTLEKLNQALHTGNHNRSDIQSDYFDVGWYVDIEFGKWNKPCEFIG